MARCGMSHSLVEHEEVKTVVAVLLGTTVLHHMSCVAAALPVQLLFQLDPLLDSCIVCLMVVV